MRALQVSVLVATALLAALESGVVAAPRGTYSYRTVHQASSSNNALTPSRTRGLASTSRQYGLERGTQQAPYSPVDYTPEVKSARKAFFKLYDKQAKLAKDAPDTDLDGRYSFTQRLSGGAAAEDEADDDYYYYYYDDEEHSNEEDEYEYEDDDDEEESHEEDEEEDDDDDDEEESHEDDEEDSEDSEEGDDSSEEDGADSSSEEGADSSSEEGGVSSSEEDGEDSSSEESSEEGADGDDSSSSSSSSEEDGAGGFDIVSWGRRNTNALLARTPRPVTDTPEVKQEKRNFFRLYKKQAELSFNAPDH
ncbi:uncharacterized protein [Penaeus vannamei]|uniref:uncharacterized protein n=1 Tax=Penaeus vannamei TaxID=6689 RepID=UPI000F66FBF3|nr:transcription initiation factor TFIID subunit 11-like [Penaeus vannamei]